MLLTMIMLKLIVNLQLKLLKKQLASPIPVLFLKRQVVKKLLLIVKSLKLLLKKVLLPISQKQVQRRKVLKLTLQLIQKVAQRVRKLLATNNQYLNLNLRVQLLKKSSNTKAKTVTKSAAKNKGTPKKTATKTTTKK